MKPIFIDPSYDCLDYITMYTFRLKSKKRKETETTEQLKKADYKQYDYPFYDEAVKDLIRPENMSSSDR